MDATWSPAQLAALEQARALGSWEINEGGKLRQVAGDCPAVAVARQRGWSPDQGTVMATLGLNPAEYAGIVAPADDPGHSRRAALLGFFGLAEPAGGQP